MEQNKGISRYAFLEILGKLQGEKDRLIMLIFFVPLSEFKVNFLLEQLNRN